MNYKLKVINCMNIKKPESSQLSGFFYTAITIRLLNDKISPSVLGP